MLPDLDKIMEVIWTIRKTLRQPDTCPELKFNYADMDRLVKKYCPDEYVSANSLGHVTTILGCTVSFVEEFSKNGTPESELHIMILPDNTGRVITEEGEANIIGYKLSGRYVEPIREKQLTIPADQL